MKWVAVSGSWRNTCPELQADLDREVRRELVAGSGIVTGGALNVDFRATELSLAHAPDGSQLKVFIPTPLSIYAAHYRQRAREGVIAPHQAESLIDQLEIVHVLGALVANTSFTVVNEDSYYARNDMVLMAANSLLAFQVNGSQGVQNAINTANAQDMEVNAFYYTVA